MLCSSEEKYTKPSCLPLFPVILLVLGVTLLPLGLTGRAVHKFCPRAKPYKPGACEIGWAYLLAMIGTALAAFAPFLAQYTDISLVERSAREEYAGTKPQPLSGLPPPPPAVTDFV